MVGSYLRGDIVRLRANRDRRGSVHKGPYDHGTGLDYQVWFGGNEFEWVTDHDLELVPSFSIQEVDPITLLRNIALVKLSRRLTGNLYSYGASNTEYKVYQFRPLLKFLRSWEEYGKRGLLIADEVGLGKTIEAAIILQELKARIDVKRVLIVCPSRLTQKWQDELQTRFSEYFPILDGQRIQRLIHDVRRDGENARFQFIGSFESLRRTEVLELLQALDTSIDYLIIDEAHHMRNSSSKTNSLGKALADKSTAVTLLSATPLQLGNRDLFHLLQMIAPEDFEDFATFEQLMEPNKRITSAQVAIREQDYQQASEHLSEIRDAFASNAIYQHIVRALDVPYSNITPVKRVELQRLLSDLNVLSAIMNRTRKREFEDDVAVREPHTIAISLSEEEQALYDAVWRATRQDYARNYGAQRKPPGFITVMRERQAASCLPATRTFLEAMYDKQSDPLGVEQTEFQFPAGDDESIDKVAAGWTTDDIRHIRNMAKDLERDTKLQELLKIVRTVLAEPAQPRILLFSYFRHTLEYLERQLKLQDIQVGMIHGGINTWTRNERIREFRQGETFRILLSSEVGAEGLDFEFCDVLINYDLPWNPMQVEQRIGRLDRFGRTTGQKIRIFNFIIAGTIEERILSRLYDRIQVFEHSVGGLEAILGETIKELSEIALSPHLSETQIQRRLDDAEERLISKQRELEAFSKDEDLLLGNSNLLDARVQESVDQGHVVSPVELSVLVTSFLHDKYPVLRMELDERNRTNVALVVNSTLGNDLDDFWTKQRKTPNHNSPLLKAREEVGVVQLAFDSRRRSDMLAVPEFVNVHHPLVSMAVEHWKNAVSTSDGSPLPMAQLSLAGAPTDAGTAWFVIYVVTVEAVRTRSLLEVVVIHEQDQRALPHIEAQLLKTIQQLSSVKLPVTPIDSAVAEEWLDRCRSRMSDKQQVIQREEQISNETRGEQQRRIRHASSAAKIRQLRSALSLVDDERLTRMRQSQIRTEEENLRQALDEIDQRLTASVAFKEIAGGRLNIVASSAAADGQDGYRSLASAWVRR